MPRLASDMEFILHDGTQIVPCPNDLLPTKGSKMPVGDQGITLEQDGATAEATIPPCSTFEQWDNHIRNAIDATEYYTGHTVSTLSYYNFSKLEGAQVTMGCSPSYSVWNSSVRKPSPLSTELYARSAGGHIHIDIPKPFRTSRVKHTKEVTRIAKNLDLFLGVPSVILDPDTRRRKLYGLSGDIRFKEYGLEYRTLSNYWIFSTYLREYIWNQVEKAISFDSEVTTDAPRSIDTSNTELAEKVLTDYNLWDDVEQLDMYLRGLLCA